MEKILKIMSSIEHDKLLHFMYGMIIWAGISIFSMNLALVSVIIIATLKEVYDEHIYKGADYKDFIWTVWMPILLWLSNFIQRSL